MIRGKCGACGEVGMLSAIARWWEEVFEYAAPFGMGHVQRCTYLHGWCISTFEATVPDVVVAQSATPVIRTRKRRMDAKVA